MVAFHARIHAALGIWVKLFVAILLSYHKAILDGVIQNPLSTFLVKKVPGLEVATHPG